MRARLQVLMTLVAGLLARAVGRRRRGTDAPDADAVAPRPLEEETLSRTTGGPAWAERTTAGLLLVGTALFLAFAVFVVVEPNTQALGILLGGGLVALAAALVLAGLLVVPQEQSAEDRTGRPHPDEQRGLAQDLHEGVQGVSRRRLITGAAGTAGLALGTAAVVVPATTIGPGPHVLNQSPWRAGIPLVDVDGEPVAADDLEVGSFITAFPRGADKRELGSPVSVVRVEPATLRLPADRRDWAPEGLMAYSKVCPHAGCAVSLFRYPTYEDQSSGPALQCPCHYSTFDVRRAGKVEFGPAGRPLPQLPLRLDAQRRLVAGGGLSDSVGPAWWGTKRT